MNALPSSFLFSDEAGPLTVLPPPRLLVEWEPRWHAFRTSLGPALKLSEARLQGECEMGARYGSHSVLSVLLHATALLVLVSIPAHVVRSQQLLQPAHPRLYEVIYYSGDELPQMADDSGGAHAGAQGRTGGRELFHPTQTIRIARGNKPADVVADAPQLKLPRTSGPVANLLTAPAIDPGPPPVSALPSARALTQPAPVQAPPSVVRDRLPQVPYVAAAVNAPPDTQLQVAGLRVPELGTAHVIPPPVSAPPRSSSSIPLLTLPMNVAVAPPPIAAREVGAVEIPGFGARQDVLPPATRASGTGSGGGSAPVGMPQVRRAGGAANLGSGAIIVSANPGTAVGFPANGGPGTLAMSPSGGSRPGFGGSGGGTGIGRGTGPGSATVGAGPGSGKSGAGPGSGAIHPGTSPAVGPGGTGTGTGQIGIRGVTVVGGNVTLPGFSTPPNSPGSMSRGPREARARPAITIIATARSGGALNAYGAFKGSKVYTIYIDTRLGIAVLQYAERSATARTFEDDLTPPEPLSSDLPTNSKRSRLLISCVMDKSGVLRNLRAVEAALPETDKLLGAIEKWRFRPVLRGNEPVEVDVMLGFAMDTR